METKIQHKCERCRFWQAVQWTIKRYCACRDGPNEGIHTGAADGCGYYEPAAWAKNSSTA